MAFNVGNEVAPFVTRNGGDLELSWPARDGAVAYRLRVWDLATGVEIPCPAELDCAPTTNAATHVGGAEALVSFGYEVQAVDACGANSRN